MINILEFCGFGCSGERYYVADVGHARDKEQQALETEAETAVRAGTEAAGIEVPPEVGGVHTELCYACVELLEGGFAAHGDQ